jgi:hypothetical protein
MKKKRKLVPVLEKESEGFRHFDGPHGDMQYYSLDKMAATPEADRKKLHPISIQILQLL